MIKQMMYLVLTIMAVARSHLEALASAPPAFRQTIVSIHCSNAGPLDDDDVITLCSINPGLKDISLGSAQLVTDRGLVHILDLCRSIGRISISGDDRCHGSITLKDRQLRTALRNPQYGRRLKHLWLMDQRFTRKRAKIISKTRLKMAIVGGETVGDSHAALMVASMTGGFTRFVYFHGGEVPYMDIAHPSTVT